MFGSRSLILLIIVKLPALVECPACRWSRLIESTMPFLSCNHSLGAALSKHALNSASPGAEAKRRHILFPERLSDGIWSSRHSHLRSYPENSLGRVFPLPLPSCLLAALSVPGDPPPLQNKVILANPLPNQPRTGWECHFWRQRQSLPLQSVHPFHTSRVSLEQSWSCWRLLKFVLKVSCLNGAHIPACYRK